MVTKISENKKVVKESYYDGMISLRELYNIKETINDLIDEMENNGITQISSSSNTYGLTNFIGTHSGFIDLDDPYQYLEYDEDEDDEESFEEGLSRQKVLNKLDQFVGQITVKAEDSDDLAQILQDQGVSYRVDDHLGKSNEGKHTFYLKYDSPRRREKLSYQLDSKYVLRQGESDYFVETNQGEVVGQFDTEEEARDFWETNLK